MMEDDVWRLIDQVNEGEAHDQEGKARRLTALLEQASAKDIEGFDGVVRAKLHLAYSWPLWAAAYIINGGCSDDSFMDFRSCLIMMGREIFEKACAAPDSLADLPDPLLESLFYEGFLYIAPKAYEARFDDDLEPAGLHPDAPSGAPWDEDDDAELEALCPRLWRRFGD